MLAAVADASGSGSLQPANRDRSTVLDLTITLRGHFP